VRARARQRFFLPSGRRGAHCSGCAQGGAAAADARPRAGGVYARNDFVCMLNCDMGPDAGRNTTRPANLTLPAAGIFNPPYAINSGNREVRAARRDMAQAHKRTVKSMCVRQRSKAWSYAVALPRPSTGTARPQVLGGVGDERVLMLRSAPSCLRK